jgi:broad specificity phosphatase PhoE
MRRILVLFALLASLSAHAQNAGKIFAVRHAEKQSTDQDTPLSDLGKARAQCLAQTLKDVHITAIFTTQYTRTKQTAEPTAHEANVKLTSLDAKSNDDVVKQARTAAQSGNVLIVGHSNTVPDIIAALGASKPTIADDAYDLLFIVDESSPPRLTTLHYCPNLPKPAPGNNSMMKP